MGQEKQPAATNIASITAKQTVRRVHWKGSAQELWVQNLHASDSAQISFDDGVEWWTIPAGRLDIYTIDTDEVKIRRQGVNDVTVEFLIFLKD